MPPVSPMLAKAVAEIPAGQRYEPKWDGFRSVIFRDGDEVEIGSRNEKPMTRYFPELVEAFTAALPPRCVIDGEIVVVDAEGTGLDFEALLQRVHPAASRVRKLAVETPAHFVAFDLLALGDDDLTGRPFTERRERLAEVVGGLERPDVHLTPMTEDVDTARDWFERFEGAGLDGLIAKKADLTYQPDKRVMSKIKHERTADCVVAGYRVHKSGPDAVGSLLLGLHTEDGSLQSIGVIGAFPMAKRRELFAELQPLVTSFEGHPWALGRAGGGHAHAARGRAQPVERAEGPVVRAAAPRARGGGQVRPHGGRPLPAHRAVQALAPRPRPGVVHLRAARAPGAVRPRGSVDRSLIYCTRAATAPAPASAPRWRPARGARPWAGRTPRRPRGPGRAPGRRGRPTRRGRRCPRRA